MGINTIIIGFYIYLLFKIPFSWLISVAGVIFVFFGYVIKKHDWYADYRERGAR
jgi:hypothetical protein